MTKQFPKVFRLHHATECVVLMCTYCPPCNHPNQYTYYFSLAPEQGKQKPINSGDTNAIILNQEFQL